MPNSSSSTVNKVTLAIESQRSTEDTFDSGISSSPSSGKTAEKQRTNREYQSSTGQFLDLVKKSWATFEEGVLGQSLLSGMVGWLRKKPTRWLYLAVWFFLGTTLLSTVLSASFEVSLWGEIPGQDGYSAYTLVAYVVLFATIATHLKTRAQLWRLLGAVAFMGTLVSLYAVLQHYDQDFLDLLEITGGGRGRVTSTMGNAIFAAAVMFLTIPISLVLATISLREPAAALGQLRKTARMWVLALAIACLWALVLMVQVLGITVTFSRGPWVGTLVAVMGFLVLTAIVADWRSFSRAALILGLTSVFGLAVLHWQGSISILGQGPWIGAVLVLVGLLGLAVVLVGRQTIVRFLLVVGIAAAIAVGIVLVPSWFEGDDTPSGTLPASAAAASDSTASEVAERLSSIKGQVLGGLFGGRGDLWKDSWRLIRDRPWFGFDSLSLAWLRPVVGYGPDLFRYTYLLESPPVGEQLLPLEPDHAHNFLSIRQ